MKVSILDAGHPHWGSELEHIGVLLGEAHNPALFPYHFLYATLTRIGGSLAIFEADGAEVGAGILFPRHMQLNGGALRRSYTLRYHAIGGAQPALAEIAKACEAALGGAQVIFYDPTGPLSYYPTHQEIGPVDIGRPDAQEAAATRDLQRRVWGSPDEFLYPSDIHSAEFAAGTSLVARVDGRPAGFLFGFYKFGGGTLPADWHARFGGDFRLESQTMGVVPEHRGLRIAHLLKKIQAERAWQEGIGIINWTADPLQYPNAALNFGLLRAIAFDFVPDLYPFRNELNRVHASRFGLTWLVGSTRVRSIPLVGARAEILDLRRRTQIKRVNDGCDRADFDVDARIIAIEIPADWTDLQQRDLAQAQAWRILTDEIFTRYIGTGSNRYVVTGVGTDNDRRYLVAERAGAALWDRLGRAETITT
ncbi:MAG: hypothetical protein H3C34_21465 [Caldilineaceae bacterium]|nr:hypothetical protein [Caldilineaceae bacterium]